MTIEFESKVSYKVACKCGWEGGDTELLNHDDHKYCPSCGRFFRSYPTKQSNELDPISRMKALYGK